MKKVTLIIPGTAKVQIQIHVDVTIEPNVVSKRTVADLKDCEVGYTVPRALSIDGKRSWCINKKSPVYPYPQGSVCMKIKKEGEWIVVDKNTVDEYSTPLTESTNNCLRVRLAFPWEFRLQTVAEMKENDEVFVTPWSVSSSPAGLTIGKYTHTSKGSAGTSSLRIKKLGGSILIDGSTLKSKRDFSSGPSRENFLVELVPAWRSYLIFS